MLRTDLVGEEKKMRSLRILAVLIACLFCVGVAMAQDTPTVEVFGGYTFIHFNGGSGTFGVMDGGTPVLARGASRLGADPLALAPISTTLTSNINGGSASLAYNLNNWFGLAADFGGSAITSVNLSGLPSVDVNSTLFTYLFGPRFSYRGNKTFTPFAQVLVGGAHITDVTAKGLTVAKAENAFAMAVGGGLDWNVNKVFAVRLGQVEYVLTRFTDPFSLSGASGTQNSVRVSAGVVFKLGGK